MADPLKHGWPHQQLRRQLLIALDGRIPDCAYNCGKPLPANRSKWHLAHDSRGGYMGFAHQSCNSGDPARFGPEGNPLFRDGPPRKVIPGEAEAWKGRRQRQRRRRIILPSEG